MLEAYLNSLAGKLVAVIILLAIALFGFYFELFTALLVGIFCFLAGALLFDAFRQHRKEPMAWIFGIIGPASICAALLVWTQ